MAILMRKGNRVCDSKCHNAKDDKCDCICKGKYHGICDCKEKKEEKKK